MSKGKRTIPQETRDKVLAFLGEGHSFHSAARLTSLDHSTVKRIWYSVHPEEPPCARSVPVPLKVMRSYVRGKVRIVDYECPHCGALIHYPVIDFKEKPWRCEYCGREVE